jgi:hypothetical protein
LIDGPVKALKKPPKTSKKLPPVVEETDVRARFRRAED